MLGGPPVLYKGEHVRQNPFCRGVAAGVLSTLGLSLLLAGFLLTPHRQEPDRAFQRIDPPAVAADPVPTFTPVDPGDPWQQISPPPPPSPLPNPPTEQPLDGSLGKVTDGPTAPPIVVAPSEAPTPAPTMAALAAPSPTASPTPAPTASPPGSPSPSPSARKTKPPRPRVLASATLSPSA